MSEQVRGTVVFFSGCAANYTDPDVGRAAVLVLEKNGFSVSYPAQKCCGMPLLRHKSSRLALDRARFNLRSLSGVEADIITTCTTCALTLRHYYPQLLGTAEAEAVAGRTYDVLEYLSLLHERGDLDTAFYPVTTSFLYHTPCHLKALGLDLVERRLRLLRQIPRVSITRVNRGCCGLAGTFGAGQRTSPYSLQVAAGLVEALRDAPGCEALTDCPGCKLQIGHRAGVPVVHPIQLLQQAYGLHSPSR